MKRHLLIYIISLIIGFLGMAIPLGPMYTHRYLDWLIYCCIYGGLTIFIILSWLHFFFPNVGLRLLRIFTLIVTPWPLIILIMSVVNLETAVFIPMLILVTLALLLYVISGKANASKPDLRLTFKVFLSILPSVLALAIYMYIKSIEIA